MRKKKKVNSIASFTKKHQNFPGNNHSAKNISSTIFDKNKAD